MLTEATAVSDKIELSDRIFNQERTIKYFEDQLKNAGTRVEYSTLYVTLTEKAVRVRRCHLCKVLRTGGKIRVQRQCFVETGSRIDSIRTCCSVGMARVEETEEEKEVNFYFFICYFLVLLFFIFFFSQRKQTTAGQ